LRQFHLDKSKDSCYSSILYRVFPLFISCFHGTAFQFANAGEGL
jgi:hypothetical protein